MSVRMFGCSSVVAAAAVRACGNGLGRAASSRSCGAISARSRQRLPSRCARGDPGERVSESAQPPEPFMILFLVGCRLGRAALARRSTAPRLARGCRRLRGSRVQHQDARGLRSRFHARDGRAVRIADVAHADPAPAVLAGVAAAASLWWVLAVDAIPSTVRPYVGGSKNNTELNLLIGYNGLGRVDGDGQLCERRSTERASAAPAASSAGSPASCGCSATPSDHRSDGCCLSRSVRPHSRSGPTASDAIVSPPSCSGAPGSGSAIVFSEAKGIFHSYYTSRSLPQWARSSA